MALTSGAVHRTLIRQCTGIISGGYQALYRTAYRRLNRKDRRALYRAIIGPPYRGFDVEAQIPLSDTEEVDMMTSDQVRPASKEERPTNATDNFPF